MSSISINSVRYAQLSREPPLFLEIERAIVSPRNRRFMVTLNVYEILARRARHKWVMRRWRVSINMIIRFSRAPWRSTNLPSSCRFFCKNDDTRMKDGERGGAERDITSGSINFENVNFRCRARESDIVITTLRYHRRSAIADTDGGMLLESGILNSPFREPSNQICRIQSPWDRRKARRPR